MNRPNIVFVILLLMLGGLGFSLATRAQAHHQAPRSPATPAKTKPASKPANGQDDKLAPFTPASSRRGPEQPPKLMDRPLSVITLGWHLAAPGVLQNDGLVASESSAFSRHGLDVRLTAAEPMSAVEHALARGGADEKGADVAIVPLPEFVASYEALQALDPVMFLVMAWSRGHDVVLGKPRVFAELAQQEQVTVRGAAGSSELFLTAFSLDLLGVDLASVKLSPEQAEAPEPVLWAVARQRLDEVAKQFSGKMLLSTAEAVRLIPYVAIAQRSLVERHDSALATLGAVWFEGIAKLAGDPTAVSRRMVKLEGGPEPLQLLGKLGVISTSSVTDNLSALGVAGLSAVQLTALFDHSWRYWRALRVVTTPRPSRTPVSGRVITEIVRTRGVDTRRSSKALDGTEASSAQGDRAPLFSLDSGKTKLDPADLVQRVGLVAGVFARSTLRLSVYSQSAYDQKATEELAEQVRTRFGLEQGRVLPHRAQPTSLSQFRLDVMPAR